MKNITKLALSVLVLLLGIGVSSCKKTETTSDGIEYTYIKEGRDAVKEGDYVIYHFEAKNAKDSLFLSSYSQPLPPYLQKNASMPTSSGIDEIFLNLKKGDSIVVKAPAEKIFGVGGVPPFLSSEENIMITIGVLNVIEEELFQDYYNDLMAAEQEKQAKKAENQLATDIELIEKYIAENNLNASRTESGLFYVIQKEGSGPEVEKGNTASVDYTGYVLDGTLFDTSVEEAARKNGTFQEGRSYEPISIEVGVGRVIKGWDEGLQLLRKGSEAKFIIPSPLAYGPNQRSEVIVPNSILVFDVVVTDVVK
ncbi:FKBP-type peptidyl-prolyl cis-trans isomerase [Lunatimonas lonarensis]|uniref:Peptidyl-prolyl cis-trans isomerase n=1 Tax=Lunatimonas lonarensis TaxID=1232681 RepID=R7ZTB9_9BACT|nr:FKBP-type peptidyl-prolyl cis-trans isomerase [Lunatimonas lonarensis]EON77375.1 FKBP-type peptidyl-prolyl cis-trans isomerase [Lunatimonas lonarensis]